MTSAMDGSLVSQMTNAQRIIREAPTYEDDSIINELNDPERLRA